jgi:GLPGLI family protein
MRGLLLPVCLIVAVTVAAQNDGANSAAAPQSKLKEGKVIYERTVQMQWRFDGMDEAMAARLPRTRTDHFELSFGGNQSLWQQLPNMNEEANSVTGGGPGGGGPGGRGQVFMVRGGPGSGGVTYHNFEAGKRVEQQELNTKNYLITDSIRKLQWKLTGETKTILGYMARKATANQYGMRPSVSMENGTMKREMRPDTSTVVAWFTTDIPVPAGPVFQGNLPGLILELDMNNGRMVYKAVEVSPKPGTIKEPKGGKPITAEEFRKENEKMMDEMMKNMPRGQRLQIGG